MQKLNMKGQHALINGFKPSYFALKQSGKAGVQMYMSIFQR